MDPERELVQSRHMPHLCMALSRLCGVLVFGISANATAMLLKKLWHIDFTLAGEAWAAGRRGKALLILPAIIGLISAPVGRATGAAIKIRNDNIAGLINIAWHYGANGFLIWFGFSFLVLSLSLQDKFALTAFMKAHWFHYSLSTGEVGVSGSWLIALLPLVTKALVDQDTAPAMGMLLSAAIGIVMGFIQSELWRTPLIGGIIVGFVFPLCVIPVSSNMWQKDQSMRFYKPQSL